MIPTPLWYPYHTEIAQWTQDSGDWEEKPTMAGTVGVTALRNKETSGQLTANFCHPEGPNFVISFGVLSVGSDYDAEATPPYLCVKWGHNPPAAGDDVQYQLLLLHDGRLEIGAHFPGGIYQQLGLTQIPWRWPVQGEEWSEIQLMILHVAGGIAVRPLTTGGDWVFFYDGDPDVWIWPEADNTNNIEVSYQGGQAWFGFHGVYSMEPAIGDGTTDLPLYSPTVEADRVRAGLPTVFSRTYVPAPAAPTVAPALTVSNVDHSGTDDVQMKADFTWGYKPASDCAGGAIAAQADFQLSYRFPYFPELYAAGQYFSPTVQAPAGDAEEIYSGAIHAIDVWLPDEGDVSNATCVAEWDIGLAGGFADILYMRTVDLAIGWLYEDDSTSLEEVITGVVAEVRPVQIDPGRMLINFRIVDTSEPLRQVECDDSWPVMDGWNAQTAALHVAAKMGWHSTLCNFTSLAECTLSTGEPHDALWQARGGQTAWEFLERIARYCGDELAVAAGGGIYTREMCYCDEGTVHAISATQIRRSPRPEAHRRHAFGYTGVIVKGRTLYNEPLTAEAADTNAENNPAYEYFRGYKRLEAFHEAGLTTQAAVDAMANALYTNMRYRVADEIHWACLFRPGDPTPPNGWEEVWRRDCAIIDGLSVGITAVHKLCIKSIHHHWARSTKDCFSEFWAIPWCEVEE